MSTDKNRSTAAFGERLRDFMRAKGLTSAGSKSGVDVAKLAEAADTTYEMARRYAEGHAMPRPDKVAAIAKWLGVSVTALAYGEERSPSAIDERLLQSCIEAIQAAQRRTGHSLSTESAARLVAALYGEASTNGLPNLESLDLLVKFAR